MAASTLQQHHIKALTPTWLLVKAARDGGGATNGSKKPASAAAACYFPLLLSPSTWQKAQDAKNKGKDDAGGMPGSPRISCTGQVKGRRRRSKGCSSARGPPARGSGPDHGHGGVLATLVLGLFGRRNGRTSRACSAKVRDVPRGGSSSSSTSAPVSSRGSGSVTAVVAGALDPPLPVLRRPVARGDDAPSLWERRRGGGKALGGLQLPYIAAE